MYGLKVYHVCEDGSIASGENEYGGMTLFSRQPLSEADGGFRTTGAYTDRLFRWDHAKHDRCTREVWNNVAQYWDDRKASDIERFITAYHGRPCRLLRKVQYTNQSNGYPVWYLEWQWLDADPAE